VPFLFIFHINKYLSGGPEKGFFPPKSGFCKDCTKKLFQIVQLFEILFIFTVFPKNPFGKIDKPHKICQFCLASLHNFGKGRFLLIWPPAGGFYQTSDPRVCAILPICAKNPNFYRQKGFFEPELCEFDIIL